MTAPAPVRLLLGPQRPVRNLAEAISAAGIPDGPLAVISAGWQEAEGDIDDVREIVGRPLEDLRLYTRADGVFTADEKLAAAYRHRQDCLKEQQRLYRQRLRQLAMAARQTLRAEADPGMLAAEQRHAIAQLRALDRHHLKRTELLHAPFARAFAPDRYALLAEHRAEIGARIRAAAGVLITGGNVVVLANRIRLFGVGDLLADAPLIGWSAGAMVLAERIVLFHDRTPEGRRDAEVLGSGTGLVPGSVVLPDARRRLRRRDIHRMTLLARRFGPDTCVVLDSGAALGLEGGKVVLASGARRLNRNGHLARVRAA
ncbi:MAG: Type 1 glutamine amidotransferase-like domain-containing protein [Woeseiaceae bacterium]|nr:Type 1 glutamine amidotransferase-like domain-containing protein [Woeseiaceae bacterium]